jgi:hypothetical protein
MEAIRCPHIKSILTSAMKIDRSRRDDSTKDQSGTMAATDEVTASVL